MLSLKQMDRNNNQRFLKREMKIFLSQRISCISSSKELTKYQVKLLKRQWWLDFFLVKLLDFKDKENVPQSHRRKKKSHTGDQKSGWPQISAFARSEDNGNIVKNQEWKIMRPNNSVPSLAKLSFSVKST